MTSTKTVAVVSGGMDSVTMAYDLARHGHELTIVTFDYGQRHVKEIDFAKHCADRIAINHEIIDIRFMQYVFAQSSLTDPDIDVPHGHYEDETMKATVIPNRNAIFLTIAYALAVREHAKHVATAVHAGDHAIYPDCRPEFTKAFDEMEMTALKGVADVRLVAPYVAWTKADIVRRGAELDVPYEHTWSCYEGGALHCGKCGTCVERREAFQIAEVIDPTEYAE